MANTNCLEGMKCPKCESEGPFHIEIKVVATVHDDGADFAELSGDCDIEWEDDSFCGCSACGFEGTVKHFRGDTDWVTCAKCGERFLAEDCAHVCG